jgi:hypothetical protein
MGLIGMPQGSRPTAGTYDERVDKVVDWAERANAFARLDAELRKLLAAQRRP